ncbi:N-formylglutamate amidohydrolase [Crateriforma conspicua]|uniref:N-formylglutamate amidohydrolase n=1 Tax=Crateriforma conspicua TaxID=2527996 RepID=A0A5C5XXH2_9PLAN|nr:N-formylglutamate amidohydrolase [Crateriforma conspicua]QDV63127.1 N-formylglutamate amidohydrolase [Crateriforma conspicua]TWT68106.1 N-formylglutamate amidohydrolase [Crateriforma conspicua]
MSVLISCETGGDRVLIPEPWNDDPQWRQLGDSVASGDAHAWYAAASLSRLLHVPLLSSPHSPDWIDVSVSQHHRRLFSPQSKRLPAAARQRLIDLAFVPYRQQVAQRIESMLRTGRPCIHLSIRTFESRLGDQIRRGDVGLGYDTGQPAEVHFCLDWIDDLYESMPNVRVRRNYPRRGSNDSLTKAMRAKYASRGYLGIEVQLNRAWVARPVKIRDEVLAGLAESLEYMLQSLPSEAA